MSDQASLTKVSLGALTKYLLWLGTFGFGGPIVLTAAMQRDLVLDRGWVRMDRRLIEPSLAELLG